ncbi:3-oxoadipate enol-lactonase [Allomuricauda sp. NBRC 101325]|uniref:bifunctional 3-oxoadipate enol-lactonase/4-carboxymuconolactone decarboxylase PcaDC n=1 Tax=Allomuricauda sp. NBRC 101325 TaxID=1113758 RepID=UPI0024A1DBF3|nr:3-oxoadipate enol-lactonase [Muricauda sp. NBRC 101325]GLU43943.1 3-oxoadipate enol-lactonase [Muricauda sp. NBRC 101325]
MKTNYKLSGTPNSPVLIFSNSLGSTMAMWDDLIPYLLPYFRILQYDTRGHGGSEVGVDPCTIEALGRDVLEIMDQLNIEKAAFCGLSMGGLIGQWLGVHAPERFSHLILSNTAAKIGEESSWEARIKNIIKNGMSVLSESTMNVWFTDAFRKNYPQKEVWATQMLLNNNLIGYANCCTAIGEADFRDSIKNIPLKTLVITGDEDAVTTIIHAEFMVAQIPNAELKVLPARHLASTELPAEFASLLIHFIVGETSFEKGMHVRRTVLGNEHVDRAQNNITEFNEAFQEMVAEVPWGMVWTRPGLTKHQRSLITLSMMIALNRTPEFKMHIKAAINNGVTPDEIKELMLQSAIYCGFPAANEAYHSAQEVLGNLDLN